MALRGYDTGSTSEPGLSNRNRRVLKYRNTPTYRCGCSLGGCRGWAWPAARCREKFGPFGPFGMVVHPRTEFR